MAQNAAAGEHCGNICYSRGPLWLFDVPMREPRTGIGRRSASLPLNASIRIGPELEVDTLPLCAACRPSRLLRLRSGAALLRDMINYADSALSRGEINAEIGGGFYHSPNSLLSFQQYRDVTLGVVANDNDPNIFNDKEVHRRRREQDQSEEQQRLRHVDALQRDHRGGRRPQQSDLDAEPCDGKQPGRGRFLGDYMWVPVDAKGQAYAIWSDTRGQDGALEEDISATGLPPGFLDERYA